jgi:uncharacterized membrane protein YfcA
MLSFELYLAAGASAGFLAGLLGIGGSAIIVPALLAIFAAQGMPADIGVPLAIGTSLACMPFTAVSSVRAHHARGSVDWPLVRSMAPGIAIGAVCGSYLAVVLPPVVVKLAFGAVLASMSTRMLMTASASESAAPAPSQTFRAASLAIGSVCGLVGGGPGTFVVPLLTRYGVRMQRAAGTASALSFPLAIVGAMGYAIQGQFIDRLPAYTLGLVHLPSLAAIAIASVSTAPLGAMVAHRVSVPTLKRVFALLGYAVVVELAIGHLT